jgi:hypothetical protein
MKRNLLALIFTISVLGMNAQLWLNLNLEHMWNDDPFNYGTVYEDQSGTAVEVTRVQYYMSGLVVTHDGGQETSLTDVYILASGNISHYSINAYNVSSLESFRFDLGVDEPTNHLDPNSYASSHPLAPKNPNMHWGWSAGYKFLAIEGYIDTNGDQVPDQKFEFHVVGNDNYLQNVGNITTAGTSSGSFLTVDLRVNVAKWLKDVDLANAGTNHGVFPVNGTIMNNTITQPVFSAIPSLGIDNRVKYENNIYTDYSQPYAPVLFYKLPKAQTTSVEILDLQGRIMVSDRGLSNEGNYFIRKELNSGSYLAVFRTDKGEVITERFIVRK